MEEDRGRSADRLVTFTDAVVAIAITLLALPLTDIDPHLLGAGLGPFIEEKGNSVLGFVISFFVIARLWWAHHRIFGHVVRWDGPLVSLTMFWLFTVVALSPATAINTANSPQDHPEVIALYIGVMTISSALLTALARHVRRHPELTDGHDIDAARRSTGSIETTIGFVVALVIGTAFPVINYFALFVLVLTGRIGGLIERRRARGR